MIKISFSGLSGSGKTSLLTEVKKILSLKYKVESIDDPRGRNPFDSNKKSSFASQFFVFSTQINEENKKSLVPLDFLLCDQSVLDQWITWKYYHSAKEKSPALAEKDEVMRALYQLWIKTYPLIFLVRTDLKELEKRELNHELRITDMNDNILIEELYKETIKEDNIKIIEIWNNTSIDECAHEILKHITGFIDQTDKESGKENGKENGNQTGWL